MAANFLGGWFIPMTVTIAGTLSGMILSKTTGGDWLPDSPPATPDKAMVRIYAGMNQLPNDLAGHVPGIVLYDELGKVWGQGYEKKKKLGMGDFFDYYIKGDHGNHRPSYIQLDAWDDDALCLAAAQITYPDGDKAIFYPDVPVHLCGAQGYPSITDFPLPGKGSSGYHPFCIWLDGNNSYKRNLPKSLHFHIPDFNAVNATVDAYNANHDLVCASSGRWGTSKGTVPTSIPYFSPPLVYNEDELDISGKPRKTTHLDEKSVLDSEVGPWPMASKYGDKTRAKRSLPAAKRQEQQAPKQDPRWAAFKSELPTLSAEYVCNMPNAVGPHYANLLEGKFCNMNDRTVWDICTGNSTSNCFDTQKEALLGETASGDQNVNAASGPSGTNVVMQLAGRINMLGH